MNGGLRMKLLGFYIGGHDSNISLVEDDGSVRYFKAERLFQQKHSSGSIFWVKKICDEANFVPDYICYTAMETSNVPFCDNLEIYKQVKSLELLFDVDTFVIDHHYAHALSGWMVASDECLYSVVIDGSGNSENVLKGDHPCVARNRIRSTIFENIYDLNKVCRVHYSIERKYGKFLSQVGQYIRLGGMNVDLAGKLMGLHSYGKVDEEYISKYHTKEYAENPMLLFSTTFHGYSLSQVTKFYNENESLFIDWLATVHTLFGLYISDLFMEYIPRESEVIYSGGVAQNSVYNAELAKLYPYIKIPPHGYDGGQSLGSIKFLSLLKNQPLVMKDFPFCQEFDDLGYASDETIEQVAQLLADGKIVGWCQGKGEIGPRALGHRSMLMNPSIKDGKDILNNRVKKRESWRPYAASIKAENISILSEVNYKCDYMLHAVKVNKGYKEMLCAVVHEDDTCRFQTVNDSGVTATFYKLLHQFELKTGILGILNTSLNAGGKPIVGNYEDAFDIFNKMDLDAICIGDELFVKEKESLPSIYENANIVLWGAGIWGHHLEALFKKYDKTISCFCDSDSLISGTKIMGYPVISPEELVLTQEKFRENLLVIISVSDEQVEKEILETCKTLVLSNVMTLSDVKKSFVKYASIK